MSPTTVAIVKCASYDQDEVDHAVATAMDLCGGLPHLIRRQAKVLLKPNLLSAKSVDSAVTTHPTIVRAIGKLVARQTSHIAIGDSPGLTTAANVMKKTGIDLVAHELAAEMIEFQQIREVKGQQLLFALELAGECLDADQVINLPKLKSHLQMRMTLAVKNLFGCVVGKRKGQWHMRAGVDYRLFARLLVDVCQAVNASFHLVDGVVAMEGEGPGNGTPRKLGIIVAGVNPFAVDQVICQIVGMPAHELFTTEVARKLEIFGANANDFQVVGSKIAEVAVGDFVRPDTYPLLMGPKSLQSLLRNLSTARPVIDHDNCRRCLVCVEACPAGAMDMQDKKIKIAYQNCIRCFCCQEMCPHQAITSGQGLLFRLVRKFFGLSLGGRSKH